MSATTGCTAESGSVLAFLLGLLYSWGLEGGVAAVVMEMMFPVSAAAARGWGVTYRSRRVAGTGGQPGGGGGALAVDGGGEEAHVGAFPLAEVSLALTDQRLLVALHPLQLLLCSHPAPSLAAGELQGLCR